MKKSLIKLSIIALVFMVINTSCEDVDNPVDGLEEVDLFVQFGANLPDTVAAAENLVLTVTIQSPISFGEDLIATVSFAGTAVFGTDFTITGADVMSGNSGTMVPSVISSSATSAEILIPFIPTGGVDLITDQVNFQINFITDGALDGQKILEVTLDGAVGTTTPSINLAGGRGPIRNDTYITIADID